MKITSKTLLVTFETEAKLGNNDAIELTLQHQAFISEGKDGKTNVDIDLGTDYLNIKFLGVAIEIGYDAFREFKNTLSKLGIDLDKLVDEKISELINSGLENKLRLMFKDQF